MRTVPMPAGAPVPTPHKPIRRAISLLVLALAGVAAAHEGHDHGAAPHGGTVAKTRRYEFEVVIRKEGLNVYPVGQGPDVLSQQVEFAAGRGWFAGGHGHWSILRSIDERRAGSDVYAPRRSAAW